MDRSWWEVFRRGSSAGQGFVQIQDELGDDGPGRVFGGVDGFVAFGFAEAEELFRAFRVGAELRGLLLKRRGQHVDFAAVGRP